MAEKIRVAAVVICGNCAVAALALIQAQAKQEAHVLDDHADAGLALIQEFEAEIARLKAKAASGLEKARALDGEHIKTNSAGGSC